MPEYTALTQSDQGPRSTSSTTIAIDDSATKICCEHCGLSSLPSPRFQRQRWPIYFLLSLSIILLVVNLTIFVIPYVNSESPSSQPVITSASEYEYLIHATDKNCIQRLSPYTPAIDAIEYLTGNLYDTYSNGDKYIGPPTAEREQSWRDLWQHEATMVENWAMPILNRTDPEPYESVKSDGKEGFTAISKVYHQLGCLDLIRQYTWLQAGKYPQHLISLEMQKPADEMRGYINRCIEDLRISLLCYSDMTPLLVTKERDLASGFKVELNSHYKCRNFQKLQEWTNSHGVEHWEKHDEFHQHDRL